MLEEKNGLSSSSSSSYVSLFTSLALEVQFLKSSQMYVYFFFLSLVLCLSHLKSFKIAFAHYSYWFNLYVEFFSERLQARCVFFFSVYTSEVAAIKYYSLKHRNSNTTLSIMCVCWFAQRKTENTETYKI